jgi:hypothetical protein
MTLYELFTELFTTPYHFFVGDQPFGFVVGMVMMGGWFALIATPYLMVKQHRGLKLTKFGTGITIYGGLMAIAILLALMGIFK